MSKIAIMIGKIIQRILWMMKRGGGTLPGTIALKIAPTMLRAFTYPKEIIIVTGTNGKSTVTNLLCEILEKSGKSVICNREGNNLKTGAASLLLKHSSFMGRISGDVLLLEVDELSVLRVMEDVTPTCIVINNFFRDQLDRAGEMENIVRRMELCVRDYTGKLLLNGDDPSVARLSLSANKADVHYFGFDAYEGSVEQSKEASEGRFCPICASELKYVYYQYSHIGRFYCEKDDFGKHSIEYKGTVVDVDQGIYEVNGVPYHSPYRALYAFYNELGAIAMALQLGVSTSIIQESVSSFAMNNGRMEIYTLKNGHTCTLNLAKNPTGQNESMKIVARYSDPCVVGLVLNDLDADGHDVSWIYDARMELLCKENVKRIYTCGTRYLDMALRMQYAGYEGEIIPLKDLEELQVRLNSDDVECFVIANYTSLQPTRRVLKGGSK
ncbi:MAG: DUF1727 domain-containing protein [Erysipelotrichaceae bacterium]|nr:DUF1727 domain-containing protein [Erysipelotrichaceae bacterium]